MNSIYIDSGKMRQSRDVGHYWQLKNIVYTVLMRVMSKSGIVRTKNVGYICLDRVKTQTASEKATRITLKNGVIGQNLLNNGLFSI